ncbi:MAG TPA: S-adenosylmethionine:tRNA ribosyltransferase-isomerase [Kofleriaceae bacterium]
MKFYRYAPAPAGASGGATQLRTDEVSRHAVRLVAVDRRSERVELTDFARLPELLAPGDLVVVNDAATLPGSLRATTSRGEPFELRLSGPLDGTRLAAVAFGAGDHRTRTENRPAPPVLAIGDRVAIGELACEVVAVSGRRIELVARATTDELWQALYAHGRPVQYAHRDALVPLWSVQTAYAARPWAAEMPSAGRALTWDVLLRLRRAGVALARLTHAAGLSSTGDDELDRSTGSLRDAARPGEAGTFDRALPWPERYELPRATIDAIGRTRARGGRVIAIGTTVVRALESAAPDLREGTAIARLRLDAAYSPRIVDAVVSGLHAPGESHFELLRAFAPRDRLVRAIELAAAHGLSAHEFGDACLIL